MGTPLLAALAASLLIVLSAHAETIVSSALAPAPAAPSLAAPAGAVAITTPTYTWNASASATSYRLQVLGAEGIAIRQVYSASQSGCTLSTGMCSVTPSMALTTGASYTWSVSAINLGGESAFSAAFSISVNGGPAAIPPVPTPVTPVGPIYDVTPDYVWNASAGAATYSLVVQSPSGTILSHAYTATDAGCGAGVGTCSVTPTESLSFGSIPYTWSVSASNSAGSSAFSAAAAFTGTSFGNLVPNAPAPVAPSVTAMSTTPTYSWTSSLTSSDSMFNVRVQATAGTAADLTFTWADAACSGFSSALNCSVTPAVALAAGSSYSWTVREFNGAGTSAFGAPLSFTVPAGGPAVPAAPTMFTPNGTITTTTPTYSWSASTGATSYILQVQGAAGSVVNQSYTAFEAGCASGAPTCSAAPATALSTGSSYTWTVGAANGAGTSATSTPRSISVSGTALSAPAAPATIWPDGAISTTTPAYSWNASSGADTYYLLVQNTAGVAIGLSYTAAEAGCPAGTGICTITPTTALTNGSSYNWFVSATSSAGTSAWSATRTISVSGAGPTVPVPPTTISPNGPITTTTPPYSWNASASATSYYLLVQNTAGVAVGVSYTATQAGCAAGTGMCTVTPANALTSGSSYNWFVSASNGAGTSAWSAARAITVSDVGPAVPAVPTTVSPVGVISTTSPTYSWNASAGATSYYLLVQNTAGAAVSLSYTATAAGCAAGTGVCAVTPIAALTNGVSYNWFVNASNGAGTSAWSGGNMFTVNVASSSAPAAPTLLAPTGPMPTSTPTYYWNASPGATSYYLLVQNTAGVAIGTSYTATEAGCGSGTGNCSVTPSTALVNGASYNWFVKASNSAGTSPWSFLSYFIVSASGPSPPVAPFPISPFASAATTTPTYSWSASAGADSYYLLVQNTAGVAVAISYTAAAAGCGPGVAICSVSPSTALMNGVSYVWFLNATNSVGTSAWNNGITFSVNAGGPSPPSIPTQVAPLGNLMTTMPTYIWNASAGATSYYLLVQNTAGVAIGISYSASDVGCVGGTGTCSVTPATGLVGATTFNWFVNATNSIGTSAWSTGNTITTP